MFQSTESYLKDYDAWKAGHVVKIITTETAYYLRYYPKDCLAKRYKTYVGEVDLVLKFRVCENLVNFS